MDKLSFVTIPRGISKTEELAVLPKKQLERLINEVRILAISREAKKMKKDGKLPLLTSLKQLL